MLAYRAKYLQAHQASETLAPFQAAFSVQPTVLTDWPVIKARKDAEKAAEAQRPGAAPLKPVAIIQWRDAAAAARGETNVWA